MNSAAHRKASLLSLPAELHLAIAHHLSSDLPSLLSFRHAHPRTLHLLLHLYHASLITHLHTADLDHLDPSYPTALSALVSSRSSHSLGTLLHLLSLGLDPYRPYQPFFNLLDLSISYGNAALTRHLLALSWDTTDNLLFYLHPVAGEFSEGFKECVGLLLDSELGKRWMRERHCNGLTPVQEALAENREVMAEVLMERGADPRDVAVLERDPRRAEWEERVRRSYGGNLSDWKMPVIRDPLKEGAGRVWIKSMSVMRGG